MAYDIFISYRRESAWAYAKMMYDRLVQDGYTVSFDTDTLQNGDFDTELLDRIKDCRDFVILLTPGCLDRATSGVARENDWVRIELATALEQGKNIVPIAVGDFRFPSNLPEDIASIRSKNWVVWQNRYMDAFFDDLEKNFLSSERQHSLPQQPPTAGSFVKVASNPSRYASLDDFNRESLSRIGVDGAGAETYVRTSYRDYLSLVLSEKRAFSVVEYISGCCYAGCTCAVMKTLLAEGARIVLSDTVDAAVRFLASVQDDISGCLLFILRCRSMSEYRAVMSIWKHHPELSLMVGVSHDSFDVLKFLRRDDCFNFKFDFLSEYESQDYLAALSAEYKCALPQRLLETLSLPAMQAVRTPLMLRTVVANLGLLDNHDNVAFNLVRVFEIIDDYLLNLNPDLAVAIDRLVSLSFEQGICEYSASDVRQDSTEVARLVDLGIIKRRQNKYKVTCEAYFSYHVASHALEQGCDSGAVDLSCFPKSVPYYIYLYHQRYEDFVRDDFALDEPQTMSLMQLFADNTEVLRRLLLDRRNDGPAMALLSRLVAIGSRDMARQMIDIYEEAGVKSCDGLDYLSKKIRLAYDSEGVLLETAETHGDILHQLGYIHYCRDEYAKAYDCLAKAYAAMRARNKMDVRLAFEYVEALMDGGLFGEMAAVIQDLDAGVASYDDNQLAEYWFVKSMDAKNAGDLDRARDFIEKCQTYATRTADLNRLSICYGELGHYCVYACDYEKAISFYERNLFISRMLTNFNGMCIASKMIGRVHLLKKEYLDAYRCFSYSYMFGLKAGNTWRLAKLDVLLWTVLESRDDFDCRIRDYCSKIESDVFRFELLTLYSQYKYSIDNRADAVSVAREAEAAAERIGYKMGVSITRAWRAFLEDGLMSGETPCPEGFRKTLSYLNDLRVREVNVTTPLPFCKYRELDTPRLGLKMINRGDARDMFDYCSDVDNTRYVLWDRHGSVNDTYRYIDSLLDMKTIGESMTWALFHKEDHVVIGTIDLVYNEKYGGVELGYIVNRRYWRKGYAFEACEVVLKFAREDLGLACIYAAAFAVNDASNALLRKCGFRLKCELPGYHAKSGIADRRGMLYVLGLEKSAAVKPTEQAARQKEELAPIRESRRNCHPSSSSAGEIEEAERTFLSRARRFKRNDGVIDDAEHEKLEQLARRTGISDIHMETLIERVECEYEDEQTETQNTAPAPETSLKIGGSTSDRFQIVIGRQVTETDINEAVELDSLSYEECYRGNLHDCMAWAKANPDIYVMLRDRQTGHIVAYINVMPVTDECYEILRSGDFIDVAITPDMILSYDMPVPYSIYFSSIVIHPDYRNTGVFRHLFNAIVERFLDLGRNEIFIHRMLADAVSPEGAKFCKLFGMAKVDASKHGSTLYEVAMIPPKFRIASAMTKQLHDYYQKKYKEAPYLFGDAVVNDGGIK